MEDEREGEGNRKGSHHGVIPSFGIGGGKNRVREPADSSDSHHRPGAKGARHDGTDIYYL